MNDVLTFSCSFFLTYNNNKLNKFTYVTLLSCIVLLLVLLLSFSIEFCEVIYLGENGMNFIPRSILIKYDALVIQSNKLPCFGVLNKLHPWANLLTFQMFIWASKVSNFFFPYEFAWKIFLFFFLENELKKIILLRDDIHIPLSIKLND